MWVKLNTGHSLNMDSVRLLYVTQSGSDWVIMADLTNDPTDQQLNGTFSSQASAEAARNRLVKTENPADFA